MKKIENLFDEMRETLIPEEIDDSTKHLRLRIMQHAGEEQLKPLLARMIENPEDHEDLMRCLIEEKGVSEPEPYEVFRNTVKVAMEIINASIDEAMREQSADIVLALSERGANLAAKIRDWDAAKGYWLNADKISEEAGAVDKEVRKYISLRLAELINMSGDHEKALEMTDLLLDLASRSSDNAAEACLIIKKAEILYETGQISSAEKLFQKAIDVALDVLGDKKQSARGWMGLAKCCNAGDDVQETIRCFSEAISDASEAEEMEVFLAASGELGYIFAQIEDYENSWECLTQALNTALSTNDVPAQINLVQKLWIPCENLKKWGDYLVSLRTIRHHIQSEGMSDLMAPLLTCFGKVHIALNNNSEALRHLDEALEIYSSLGYEEGIIEVEQLMASITD